MLLGKDNRLAQLRKAIHCLPKSVVTRNMYVTASRIDLFVVEPVEILFLVGGASGWSVPAAVATVFGGRGNGRLWKKDGMEGDDGVVAPFCFPIFTMVNGRSESTSMLVANAEVEGERGKLASVSG